MTVRVVHLPGVPLKGDVSDFLDMGGTFADIEALTDQPNPEPDQLDVATESTDVEALPDAICALEFGEPEPIQWSIEGFWTGGDFGVVFADAGMFKTACAIQIGTSIAAGGKVFGHFAAEEGPVLIVSAEDPAEVIVNRARALCRGHGYDIERTLKNLHVYAPVAGVSLNDSRWIEKLKDQILRHHIKCVVLDPLYELTTGEENSSTDQRPTIKSVRSLTLLPSKPSVLVSAHAGKDGLGKRKIDRLRGSSAWYSAARVCYFLDSKDSGQTVTVECVKMSRAPKPAIFVVRPRIEADPANAATWRVARLEYESVAFAALGAAEAFILEQLAGGVRLNTSELKAAAQGKQLSAVDLARALKVLEIGRRIDFEPGPRGAKKWGLRELAENPQQPDEPSLLTLLDGCSATSNPRADLALPSRGVRSLASSASSSAATPATSDATSDSWASPPPNNEET